MADDPTIDDDFLKKVAQRMAAEPGYTREEGIARSDRELAAALASDQATVREIMKLTGLGIREMVSRALQEMLERTPKT